MRERLLHFNRCESGAALVVVLLLLIFGGLLLIPTLDYTTTNLKAGELQEKKLKGLYAADSGIEDALWKISNNATGSLPYAYQLNDLNGMTIDVVIDSVTTIAGEDMGTSGEHDDYLIITKTVTYDSGIYDYTMSFSNNGTGNIKVEKILIDFPPNLDYVAGSTSGDFTNDDPNITGNNIIGITVVWLEAPPYPTVPESSAREHNFQLSGPPDVAGVEGHGVVKANRQDVGTVWDSDSYPYSILAKAKDSSGTLVSTIEAGVWAGNITMEVTFWQINP